MTEVWPNFFIVGAMKAGTSSLYRYLKVVPGVYLSEIKEPHYFSSDVWPRTAVDEARYLSLFRDGKSAEAIGEASASYLIHPETPKRIRDTLPGARIIIMLRDPIERAYSHYLETVSRGNQKLSFYNALQENYKLKNKEGAVAFPKYIERGLYSEQVKRYLDAFGKDQVKIVIFEEFVQNTMDIVKDILNFLGVRNEPKENIEIAYNSFFVRQSNLTRYLSQNPVVYKLAQRVPARLVKLVMRSKLLVTNQKPPMEEKARIMLQDVYRDDVKELEHVLGRTVPWQL